MGSLKFIAGPCVIESAELLDAVGERLAAINRSLGTEIKVGFLIYKGRK